MSRIPQLPGGHAVGPSGLLDVCVCAALRLLSRFCSRELSRALDPHGLNINDFHLLIALRAEPLPQMALARSLHFDSAAVSRLVARAARRGEIARVSRSPRAFWELTHYGRSALEVVSIPWEAVDESLRQALGAELVSRLLARAETLPRRNREPNGVWRD
ncbi:MAG TPA: MarR family transcriptional regulator [Myxococcaceae bacterium]|nr:MarR family transcriptional regulator [Myxococcaceae bacterium]